MLNAILGQSIRRRLFVTSLPLLTVFLLLAGFGLDRAYQQSVTAAEFQTLQLQLWSLMADADIEQKKLLLPDVLQEPRFSRPESELLGFVVDANNQSLWRSPSAELSELDVSAFSDLLVSVRAGQLDRRVLDSGEFVFRQGVTYVNEHNEKYTVTFIVVELGNQYRVQRSIYRSSVLFWLSGILIALMFLQYLVLNWGLSPLAKLADEVKDLERGTQQRLNDDYPQELLGVTDNLNRLLITLKTQKDRYRNTLSDLAHSLKTPLAVLRAKLERPQNKVSDGDARKALLAQIDTMDSIVSHQLRRAVGGSVGEYSVKSVEEGDIGPLLSALPAVSLAVVVDRVCRAMKTIYVDKHLAINVDIDGSMVLPVDEGDLMEVLGNVIDNAFKFSVAQISILAVAQPSGRSLVVTVADDGVGITAEQRAMVIQRGVRLDSSQSGQGIGLTVAQDIVDAYGGELSLHTSALGGLEVKIQWPCGG